MSIARVYAKALFEAIAEQSPGESRGTACDETEKDLDRFLALLQGSKEARMALVSPLTTSREKAGLVQALAPRMALRPLVSRFLALLAAKGRVGLLGETREAFSEVRLAAEGGVTGWVTASEPMSDPDVEALAKAFSRKLRKKVFFRVSADPGLLAGVKVTVNGVTYDGTLRSQLVQLRDQLAASAARV